MKYNFKLNKQAQDLDISVLRAQVKEWAFQHLAGKTFTKDGLKARVTRKGIKEIVSQFHGQKRFQLLALLDLEKLLKKAKPYRLDVPDKKGNRRIKAWHYYEVDIYGTPSLINIREDRDGKIIIHTISEKSK